MGVYLPKPRTEKESEYGGESKTAGTAFGLTAMQGWRQYMEDAHLADPEFRVDDLPQLGLFGVFDGHGGPAVSAWVAKVFTASLRQEMDMVKQGLKAKEIQPKAEGFDDNVVLMCESLQRTFLKLDETMKSEASREELKFLHEEAERKKKLTQEDDSDDGSDRHPESLLEAIFGGMGGKRPFVRMIEQDGQKFFQLVSQDAVDEEEDEEDDSDDRQQRGFSRFEDLGQSTDDRESVSSTAASEKREQKGLEQEIAESHAESGQSSSEEDSTEAVATAQVKKSTDRESDSSSEEKEKVDVKMEDSSLSDGNQDDADDLMSALSMGRDGKQAQPFQPECCGTTAIVVMVVGGDNPMLITANAGDSRAVLCRAGLAIPLSKDHKPGLRGEAERIAKAGGKVINGRVDGNLNLSRSIGDLFYKRDSNLAAEAQKITAAPDVRVIPLTKEDEFVIVACDGIWDCLSNQKAVDILREKLSSAATPENEGLVGPEQLSQICEEICDSYLSKNPLESEGGIGCDNMTLMIVQLKPSLLVGTQSGFSAAKGSLPTLFYGVEPDLSELPPTSNGPLGSSFIG